MWRLQFAQRYTHVVLMTETFRVRLNRWHGRMVLRIKNRAKVASDGLADWFHAMPAFKSVVHAVVMRLSVRPCVMRTASVSLSVTADPGVGAKAF